MDPTEAVLGAVVIIVGTTIIRIKRHPDPKSKVTPLKVIIFGFLLALALLAIAIVAPDAAKILAALGIVGAFALNGQELFTMIGDLGR